MTDSSLLDATTEILELGDGRRLGIAQVGAKGSPDVLFFFHGWPGSRAGVLSLHEAAAAREVRVIGMDRPGIGLSSPKPGRTVLDWPDDVAEAADLLGVERFSVAGISGGGPYALACAYKLSQRLHAVGLIAGMGPFSLGIEEMREANQQLFGLASKANWLLRFFFWLGVARHRNNATKLKATIQKMMADLPEVDMKILSAPGLDGRFALELKEAFRQGALWPAREGRIYTQPWGFSLEQLPDIPSHVWHGELDVNVPIGMSRTLVERAPHFQGHFYPGEGHISLLANHMDEILDALTPQRA